MPLERDKIREAIDNARNTLESVVKKISHITFPDPKYFNFNLANLDNSYIEKVIKEVPAGFAKEYKETDFLYIFKVLDTNVAIEQAIAENFKNYRNAQDREEFKGKKDCCRCNNVLSEYLYIGRSQKLRGRLRQHLRESDKGIFAMHMLRWSANLDCKIEVSYYEFKSLDNLIIQALEDSLWQSFCPMFGRKGEK